MLGNHFRPSGSFSWVFKRLQKNKWDIFGCLSTEDRCLAALRLLRAKDQVNKITFLRIQDPSSKFTGIAASKLHLRLNEFISLGGSERDINDCYLFDKDAHIVKIANQFIENSNGNVIIDISSFPKRYFFPLLRLLLESETILNLIATYTIPDKYTSEDLAEDPESWLTLPLFKVDTFPEPKPEVALVGVGFLPFGLADLLKNNYSGATVKLFFPFPPGPPSYQRSWRFVKQIEHDYPSHGNNRLIRVNALDTSDTYQHICIETDSGRKRAILAPYGPKPISLAMCIYATLAKAPVYYTQPRIYNPDYSDGIKETYAYCIRLDGRNFYSL